MSKSPDVRFRLVTVGIWAGVINCDAGSKLLPHCSYRRFEESTARRLIPSRELLLLPDEKCGNSEFQGDADSCDLANHAF
jgi:hypothetical protein